MISIPSGKMSADQYRRITKKLGYYPQGIETAVLLGYSVRGIQHFLRENNIPVVIARFLRLLEKTND